MHKLKLNRSISFFHQTFRYDYGAVETADTAYTVALSYSKGEDPECDEKAKEFLEECIGIYMEKLGPYEKRTLKAQVI